MIGVKTREGGVHTKRMKKKKTDVRNAQQGHGRRDANRGSPGDLYKVKGLRTEGRGCIKQFQREGS